MSKRIRTLGIAGVLAMVLTGCLGTGMPGGTDQLPANEQIDRPVEVIGQLESELTAGYMTLADLLVRESISRDRAAEIDAKLDTVGIRLDNARAMLEQGMDPSSDLRIAEDVLGIVERKLREKTNDKR